MQSERPVRRHDLRQVRGFQQLLIKRPVAALVLAVLLLLAGAARALGWAGPAGARSDAAWRSWTFVLLCWSLAAWVVSLAWRGRHKHGLPRR